MKETILAVIGVIGAFVAHAFGGWDAALVTLCVFMGIDLLSGVLLAAVFHSSPKSEGGALSSGAMSKGLVRKVMALLCVLIGERLDLLLGVDYVRYGIIIAFCVNELLSIVENMGMMGIPLPAPLKNAIDLLKSKSEPPSKTDT
jgi:toxin secretion/phage lysis holin